MLTPFARKCLLLALLFLVSCKGESPADGFSLFIKAVLAKDAQAYQRLSPETRQQVALSAAKYATEHPGKHLSPAAYLFHEGTLDRLAIGVKRIDVLIVTPMWAKLKVDTFQDEILEAVMQKEGDKWTFHTENAPDFLYPGTP